MAPHAKALRWPVASSSADNSSDGRAQSLRDHRQVAKTTHAARIPDLAPASAFRYLATNAIDREGLADGINLGSHVELIFTEAVTDRAAAWGLLLPNRHPQVAALKTSTTIRKIDRGANRVAAEMESCNERSLPGRWCQQCPHGQNINTCADCQTRRTRLALRDLRLRTTAVAHTRIIYPDVAFETRADAQPVSGARA